MWKLKPGELRQLEGNGDRFAQFVDRLIRAEAAMGGLLPSEVRTQLLSNIKDGGVDTQVTRAIPSDRSGWFSVPTCWQFKSVEAKVIKDRRLKKKKNDLQQEINKPYARKLIEQGYGYRFCLLGGLSPPKLKDWEEQLKDEVQRIHTGAADPRVIHGSDLLAWAERFLGVVAWLRNSTQEGLYWEAWEKNCRKVTEVYVSNPLWEDVRERILQHIDFNTACVGGRVCWSIGGAAGVGKTRLVFEILNESPASPSLVVYARDEEDAKKLAAVAANHAPDQPAIIVADECSSETRFSLNEHLSGHGDRIRVICLTNTGPKRACDAWLERESIQSTTPAILEQNFADVPEDRRRHYAQISRGFVRLAADMCQHDLELAGGGMSSLSKKVEDYVTRRLDTHLALVSLLALFHKVGFKDEMQTDVEALCKIANRTRQDFVDAVRDVRESPGFVVQAGRYWYVTPEIVAQVLFAEGWARWIHADLGGFLRNLPGHLQQQFIERVAAFGGEEVRDQLASFFRVWFSRLTAEDLADSNATLLASAIIESKPEEYLPELRHIIDGAEAGELMKLKGDWNGLTWGPRRILVWLLEKLVAFPEFFEDCEACLFRLALYENEAHIGNNATGIWRNLFGVQFSGTAATFEQRIETLKDRMSSPHTDEVRLAFGGLHRVFVASPGHPVGPPEVAGRLKPGDWEPNSPDEERGCYKAALSLCGLQLACEDHDRRSLAIEVLVDRMYSLLRCGFLDEIAAVLAEAALEEKESRRLVNAVDKFLEIEQPTSRDRMNERDHQYIQKVRQWVDSIRPSDFDGKFRSICAA